MPRGTSILATIAVVIAVAIGAGARAQELSCPPGYAPDQNNTSCVPSQPSAGPAQGGVAGQAQQLLNTFGAAVQGAPSKAAGALGGMLNSFGLGSSGAAPQGDNGGTAQGVQGAPSNPAGALGGTLNSFGLGGSGAAPQGDNSGTAQGGVGGGARNGDYGAQHPLSKTAAQGGCPLLTAHDVAAVLGESVNWSSAGAGTPDSCAYSTTKGTDVRLSVNGGGRREFDRTIRALQQDYQRYGPGCQTPPCLAPLTKLSGVGDAAYLNASQVGGSGAEVYVIKGGTNLQIDVQSDNANLDNRSAVALARKVADRMKSEAVSALPERQPTKCALLTADDVAAVLGGGWTLKSSGPTRPLPGAPLENDCTYDGPAADDNLGLTVSTDGGRAQFDQAHRLIPGMTALSGVGDAAFEHVSPGVFAQVYTMKGDTYFQIILSGSARNLAGSAAAFARKVADRIETKGHSPKMSQLE